MNYVEFLDSKAQGEGGGGINSGLTDTQLFPFQQSVTEWALSQGRSAIFADCGLGKTPMQLEWARQITEHTTGNVLVLTPLAVASQTLREAAKFGIAAAISHDGTITESITITNYEKLHYFNASDFQGVVCDESSILKSFDGVRKASITEFMRLVPYRLLCTATAAPNDYIELGTSSEALGYLGYMDMLARFFVNDQNTSRVNRLWAGDKWRFKGHAQEPFWRWVCSWARALRRPSDLGFSDNGFILPPLNVTETLVKASIPRPDMLFDVDAIGLAEEREVRRRTIKDRCEAAASIVNASSGPAVMWCHLNDEGDLLERLVPDAIQVSGADSDDSKESKLLAFQNGDVRVLITKPKIGGFGLNWQHCSLITYFVSHSYEQYYQAIRRCWRFGQDNEVNVHVIGCESDSRVLANLQRKAEAADTMFTDLVGYMHDSLSLARGREFTEQESVPSWL